MRTTLHAAPVQETSVAQKHLLPTWMKQTRVPRGRRSRPAVLVFVGVLLARKMPRAERGLHLYCAGNAIARQGGRAGNREQPVGSRDGCTNSGSRLKAIPQGLKPSVIWPFSARPKSCPFTEPNFAQAAIRAGLCRQLEPRFLYSLLSTFYPLLATHLVLPPWRRATGSARGCGACPAPPARGRVRRRRSIQR